MRHWYGKIGAQFQEADPPRDEGDGLDAYALHSSSAWCETLGIVSSPCSHRLRMQKQQSSTRAQQDSGPCRAD